MLIAPLVNSVENNTIELLRLPVLGPVLLRLIGIRTLENRGASFFKIAPDPARLMRLYSEQFTWAGTETAVMSFLSTDALGDYRPDYKRAGAGRPVLIVRGTADREITAAMMADARRAIPHARYVSLKGIWPWRSSASCRAGQRPDHRIPEEIAPSSGPLAQGF